MDLFEDAKHGLPDGFGCRWAGSIVGVILDLKSLQTIQNYLLTLTQNCNRYVVVSHGFFIVVLLLVLFKANIFVNLCIWISNH